MKSKLLPSDELHFLRWFWKHAGAFIDRYGEFLDQAEALDDYEKEFGRAAPADYKAGVA